MVKVEPSESALLIPVQGAEPVVGEWRERFDPSAAWGVPAHVTILYPFVPPESIDDGLVDDLRTLFGSVSPFPFRLDEVRWFGNEVLWLAPEPDAAFRELTRLVANRWPEFPPYGGKHPDPTPHLTVARGGPTDGLDEAARLLAGELPIRASAEEVHLMVGAQAPNSWSAKATFRLGG